MKTQELKFTVYIIGKPNEPTVVIEYILNGHNLRDLYFSILEELENKERVDVNIIVEDDWGFKLFDGLFLFTKKYYSPNETALRLTSIFIEIFHGLSLIKGDVKNENGD